MVVLTDGCFNNVKYTDMISPEFASTSTSTEYDVNSVAYQFEHVKSDIRKVNNEIARIKDDLPVYLATPVNTDPNPQLIAKLGRCEHVNITLNDSYLLKKVEFIRSIQARGARRVLSRFS
jgi:hypothetical protein